VGVELKTGRGIYTERRKEKAALIKYIPITGRLQHKLNALN
jgi:hypothetical protein